MQDYPASLISGMKTLDTPEHSIRALPHRVTPRRRGTIRYMPLRFAKPCLVMLIACLLFATALADPLPAVVAPGTNRIRLQPPPLARLAAQVARADATTQWDFAGITLDALLDVYQREMQDSTAERLSSQARRTKLARWQRATQDLIGQLQAARLRLLDGAAFSLYVDPQQQVLIVIDGQPIAVTAPRAEAERAIEEQVLAQFCAYNDCSVLATHDASPDAPSPLPAAVWVMQQRARPALEIDGLLRCEFSDIAERERKARLCSRLAAEVEQLLAALAQASGQGFTVDWEALAGTPPEGAMETRLIVNAAGAFVQLSLPTLAQLDAEDWRALVLGLDPRSRQAGRIPLVRRLAPLLRMQRTD